MPLDDTLFAQRPGSPPTKGDDASRYPRNVTRWASLLEAWMTPRVSGLTSPGSGGPLPYRITNAPPEFDGAGSKGSAHGSFSRRQFGRFRLRGILATSILLTLHPVSSRRGLAHLVLVSFHVIV